MNQFKQLLKIAAIVLGSIIAFIMVRFIVVMLYFDHAAPISEKTLGDYPSPDGKHICSVYVSDGGATTPWTVVAEVSGTWIIGKRTVYVADHIDEAKVIWIDDRTVWINGASIDIYRDKYVADIDELNGS